MYLYAFDASNLSNQLFKGSLGAWVANAGNPTPVVTVANKKVYVTAASAIKVFGLHGHSELEFAEPSAAVTSHVVYAIVKAIRGNDLIVLTRTGKLIAVDIKAARALARTGVLYANKPVALYGTYDVHHVYHVTAITGAYGLRNGPAYWPPDR